MALKLSLKPGERLAINGAVVVNGDRRASLIVENQANVLRERDILQPDDATTPAKRVYLPVMLMALEPANRAKRLDEFERRLTEFVAVVRNPEILGLCLKIAAKVANGDYYKALGHIRLLIDFEATRLAPRVPSSETAETTQTTA